MYIIVLIRVLLCIIWLLLLKYVKLKRLKVKILTYTCFYYKIVVNLRIYTDITN